MERTWAMGLMAFVDCRTFWVRVERERGGRSGARELQEEQKADRGFGECSSAAVATAAAALPNDAAAAAREGAKMGAGGRREDAGREGRNGEGPAEQAA